MTIINPNSIAGITSVTAEAGVMNFYKSDGTLAGLQLNGVNFNTATGVSTFNNLYVGGVLTYEDVKNVDSVGIVTARTGVKIPDGQNLTLGTDGDVGIKHQSGHFEINNATGNTYFQTNGQIRLRGKHSGSTEEMIIATAGSSVDLYWDGNKKLETTSTGVTVTGGVTATSFVGGLPITSGADNRVITASSASAIQGESNLTFNGSLLNVSARIACDVNSDIDMSNSADGQLVIGGNGYTSAIALNDEGMQIYHNSASRAIIFGTNETERLRITSGGCVFANNFGIGTDSNWKIRANTSNTDLAFEYSTSSSLSDNNIKAYFQGSSTDARLIFRKTETGSCGIEFRNGTTQKAYQMLDSEENMVYLAQSGVHHRFYTGGSTESFRINNTGVVQVTSERLTLGTSVTNGGANDGNLCVEFSSASRNAVKLRDTHNTGSTTYMVLVGGSATVGSITGTTGQASYNNLSDYRSKENDVKITDGIAKLKLLRPIRFNYKTDSSTLCDGFFAHEVTPAVPTAVTGEKDVVDSEGKIDAQMLDTSKMVPLLTAAIQEAIAKIETLEAEVASLKSS